MNAVIVAAGRGTRLEAVTGGRPKCLTDVGGRPLIESALDALEAHGVKETAIVLGHREKEIREHVGRRGRYLVNPWYATTNNMASLWLAVPHMGDEPFIYLHADVAFDPRMLEALMAEEPKDGVSLLVDPDSIDEEAMKVRLEDGRFVESSKQIPLDQAAGEWTGIARFSPQAAARFYEHAGTLLLAGEHQVYDTAAFNRMAAEGVPFHIAWTHGAPWQEIDTPDDLESARGLFPTSALKEEEP